MEIYIIKFLQEDFYINISVSSNHVSKRMKKGWCKNDLLSKMKRS